MAKVCTVCRGRGQQFIEFRTRRKSYWKDCPLCEGLGLVDLEWLRDAGIDHILMSTAKGWNGTACDIATPNGDRHSEPKRRCRKCREQVKQWRPWRKGIGHPIGTGEAA